jgi:hypothetical protein
VSDSQSVGCDNCGAVLQIAATTKATVCPYCAHPSIVDRPPSPDRPVPSFAVGFVLSRDDAFGRAQRWIRGSSLFARSDFRRAPLEAVRSVYLPAYLYGAIARSSYSAEIGENYTVTETYTTTDAKGNTVTRTRTRTVTEWRSLSGQHECYVRDVVVTASRGLPNPELEAVEPFDMRAFKRYDGAMIAGWTAEEPSLARSDCLETARSEAQQKVMAMLGRFMPGDKHRSLQANIAVSDEVLDLVMLPVWVFAARYRDDAPPVRIVVNGQTGKVGGDVPLSWLKIGIAIALAVIAVVAIVIGVTS